MVLYYIRKTWKNHRLLKIKNDRKIWHEKLWKHLQILYLTSRSNEQYQPKHKQNHLKLKQLNKLNKIFTRRQKLILLNIPISKYVKNLFLSPISVHDNICKTWKKILGPLKIDLLSKWKTETKSIANFNEMLLKIVILKSSEPFLCL